MGCDIHCYIEHCRTRDGEKPNWWPFGGRINPGRNYRAFGFLAGVRGGTAIVEPRGLPDDLAWESLSDSTLFISKDSPNEENNVSPEKAEEYVAKGYSRRVDEHRISHPNWHSRSWLTPAEWKQAVTETDNGDAYCGAGPEYHAMTAAMEELERRGQTVRVVFWFDN